MVTDTFFAIYNAHILFQKKNPLFFESMINGDVGKNTADSTYQEMLELNNEINRRIDNFLDDGIRKWALKPDLDTA